MQNCMLYINPSDVVVDSVLFLCLGSSLRFPHSSINSLLMMGALVTGDLSEANPTPIHAARDSPGPTNHSTSPLSSLIG